MGMSVRLKPGTPPLMPHQIESIKFKLKNPIGGDFSEVGTGKTPPMAIVLQARSDFGDSKRILWVTTNTMKEETAREIRRWTFLDPVVLTGTSLAKQEQLRALKGKDCFIITNYDSLPLVEKELVKHGFDSVVCDESSAIKNYRAKRSRSLYKISKNAKFRWIMTGTPMPNTVLDIFGQWRFVEPDLFQSLTEFKREYCVYIDRGWPILVGYKNLDLLQKLLFQRAVRYRRDECFQLPERTFIRRDVKLGSEQKRVYKELKEQFLCSVNSGETVTVKGILDQLIKLSEVTSGFIKDSEGKIVDLKENQKLTELKTLLDECDLPNTKVIIWCVFRHTIKKLQTELQEFNPAVLYGEVKAEDRTKELDKLRTDPKCRILIAQVATGEGFTINEAPISIYFENDFSWKNRDQSLGRNYRHGQTRKVIVFDLVCPGTVDAAKLKALESKKNVQDVLTGDNLREVVDGQI